ncbi:YifB family Mg chelatase-like AAA ATPase [Treponema parvum]|uniref:YifB family Mg chelatase-like AAA ATPase n=1 Tax=Treponema parvum TaxID=138851 RepID=A0A975IDT5_9SPIR|nr:YifB family Mg chelatase-like AAA ATPase [Treponema parvum]QTQ13335.1 YifB family Mg chelatase-like AAA ATPase [Treponema parvum]
MRIFSFSPFGYEGALVSVEVDLRRGIPSVDLVGLADGAVRESRERMRSAICNAGFEFPQERVLISLSPADLKKEGAGFDLAIALAVLQAKKQKDEKPKRFLPENNADYGGYGDYGGEKSILVMGELELCGNVRPVRGIHAAAETAASAGIRYCIVPAVNSSEAQEVCGMRVFSAATLKEAFFALEDTSAFKESSDSAGREILFEDDFVEIGGIAFSKVTAGFEFSDVVGQPFLIRGLQIAAAGFHNLLVFGPPGCGKSMALQKFPALLPLLTVEESRPVTRIYSLAGILPVEKSRVRLPPFRMPHQTASIEGLCGGGPACKPGEISLAHNGVLFLDEAPEFKTSVLQMLRVPLESGYVTLSRAGRSSVYPASFQLLMAANPCPCGNFGSKNKICLCSTHSIELYWKRFSGPLLDRIDMRIRTDIPFTAEKFSTEELRKGVALAVKMQRKRQGKRNARLNSDEIATFCRLSDDAENFLDAASKRYGFSPRASASCLKLSRTVADLEGSEDIKTEHIKEAVEYRKNSGGIDFV